MNNRNLIVNLFKFKTGLFWMSDLADKIIVVIRKRPLGKKELAKKDEDIVDVQAD
jgi:hypothetical protein